MLIILNPESCRVSEIIEYLLPYHGLFTIDNNLDVLIFCHNPKTLPMLTNHRMFQVVIYATKWDYFIALCPQR